MPQPQSRREPHQPLRGAGVGLRDRRPAVAQHPYGRRGEPPSVGGPCPVQEYVAPLGQQLPVGLAVAGDQPAGPAVRLGRVLQRRRVRVARVPGPVHPRQADQGGQPQLRIAGGLGQRQVQLAGGLLQPPGQVAQGRGQLDPDAGGRRSRRLGRQPGRQVLGGLPGQGGAFLRVGGAGQQGQQDPAEGGPHRRVGGRAAGLRLQRGPGLAQRARVLAELAEADQGLRPPHHAVEAQPRVQVRVGGAADGRELPFRRCQQLGVRLGDQGLLVQHPAQYGPGRRGPDAGHRPLGLREQFRVPLPGPQPQQDGGQLALRLARRVLGPGGCGDGPAQYGDGLVQSALPAVAPLAVLGGEPVAGRAHRPGPAGRGCDGLGDRRVLGGRPGQVAPYDAGRDLGERLREAPGGDPLLAALLDHGRPGELGDGQRGEVPYAPPEVREDVL
ncbi:hypothetical protein VR46_12440, partial [Streptomyces sp. NRRL S-444]